MVVKISYKSQKHNARLTDFAGLKEYVISNSVKHMPRTIKEKRGSDDSRLSIF
jgi:hypothetical protein